MSLQEALSIAPTTRRKPICELADGEAVDAVFAVRERERRTRRSGEAWLRLVVGDADGTVEAVAWEDAETLFDLCEPGSVIHLRGRFEIHAKYGSKITIGALRAAVEGDYDLAEICPVAPIPAERLEQDLRSLVETVQQPHLRQLLDTMLGSGSEVWQRYRRAPAAKYYHQAYAHGLLEHSLSVAQAVSAAASTFPGIDRDVAVTGALLHDIGKLDAYNDDPLSIDLTDAGRLEGEIPLGYFRIRTAIEQIEGFPVDKARAVLHIILSHHGKLEHGSPVVPATREATLVHAMDNLGGTLGSFDRIERELPDGEAWSKFDRGISSAAWFGSRAA